jgi:hypothetical protein
VAQVPAAATTAPKVPRLLQAAALLRERLALLQYFALQPPETLNPELPAGLPSFSGLAKWAASPGVPSTCTGAPHYVWCEAEVDSGIGSKRFHECGHNLFNEWYLVLRC